MKKTPYAVSSFDQIINDGYYYVDKTRYIAELENCQVPVFLRPRRFGKSLWCSTLACYYDINRKDKFDALFGQTWIGRHPTPLKNSFMVLRMNFSVVTVKPDIKVIEENFTVTQGATLQTFLSRYAHFLGDLKITREMPIANQLQIIIEKVNNNDLPPLYIIIDEYDNFTNQLITTRNDDRYKELTTGDSFLRSFFKVIKSGVELQSVGKVFITGVLPITIDDLTSGFNIAEIVTLEEKLVNMLGFTHPETRDYLTQVFDAFGFDPSRKSEILSIMNTHYNGYRFVPEVDDTLFNSTIVSYFLKRFVLNDGKIPRELIDENLKTDISWIERLTTVKENTDAMMDALVFDNRLPYDTKQLVSKFNMRQFFERDYYPVSLFYLGMVACLDDFAMYLPNNTLREIFTDYYNELNDRE